MCIIYRNKPKSTCSNQSIFESKATGWIHWTTYGGILLSTQDCYEWTNSVKDLKGIWHVEDVNYVRVVEDVDDVGVADGDGVVEDVDDFGVVDDVEVIDDVEDIVDVGVVKDVDNVEEVQDFASAADAILISLTRKSLFPTSKKTTRIKFCLQ